MKKLKYRILAMTLIPLGWLIAWYMRRKINRREW